MWTPSIFKRAKFLTGKPTPVTVNIDHRLKTHPGPFMAIRGRVKKHEVRWNDRGFEVGHLLQLDEYDPSVRRYTQRFEVVRVSYLSRGPDYSIPEGVVVLSIEPLGFTEVPTPGIELAIKPGAYGP